jgi:cytochrome c oxidase subunit IV
MPMAETKVMSPSEIAEEHEQEAHAPYLWVWFGLAILTAVEYFYAAGFKDFFVILLGGLLVLAGVKAGMVGWYFMHLKFEGKWVYLLIIPAVVLATILTLALVPDQALKPVDTDVEESVQIRRPGVAPDRPPLMANSTMARLERISRRFV